MTNLMQHIKKVAKDDVRLYFAPFVGAIDAIKNEVRRSDSSVKSDRQHVPENTPR